MKNRRCYVNMILDDVIEEAVGAMVQIYQHKDVHMKAIVMESYGTPDVLEMREVLNPIPELMKPWFECMLLPSTIGTEGCSAASSQFASLRGMHWSTMPDGLGMQRFMRTGPVCGQLESIMACKAPVARSRCSG